MVLSVFFFSNTFIMGMHAAILPWQNRSSKPPRSIWLPSLKPWPYSISECHGSELRQSATMSSICCPPCTCRKTAAKEELQLSDTGQRKAGDCWQTDRRPQHKPDTAVFATQSCTWHPGERRGFTCSIFTDPFSASLFLLWTRSRNLD